jgi:ubiquinone/menaquinone biosynthesis C-methylase UbiE
MDKLELSFDQYQRYKIVEELVELIRDGRRLRVLDVGGHPGFIADFLPQDDISILDTLSSDFGELSRTERLNYVQGDGVRLPFEDDSFDLVVSIDTLEHIPSGQKLGFLEEQLRASRDYVLLAAPFENENVSLAEQIVNEFFIKKIGHPNDSLEEHFENGLPRLLETLSFLDENRAQHLEIPNGYLYNWLIMMMALPAAQSLPDSEELVAMINRFYNQNLYVSDNREPCYRTVILASKQHSLDKDFIIKRYEKPRGDVTADTKLKLADLLLSLKLEETRLAVLEEELEKRTEWAFQLTDEVAKRDEVIRKLQAEFAERTEWAFKLREEVEERERRVSGLQDELEEQTGWALKLREESEEKGQRVVELQDDLEKRDEHLGKLQEEFEERTEWALQLRDEAKEKDRRILSIQDELEVQTQWALQLLEELEQRDQSLRQLQNEFEERTQWALQLDEELTRIRQSWIYKLFMRGRETKRET